MSVIVNSGIYAINKNIVNSEAFNRNRFQAGIHRVNENGLTPYEFKKFQNQLAISIFAFAENTIQDFCLELNLDTGSESYLKMNDDEENDTRFKKIAVKRYRELLQIPDGFPMEVHVHFEVLLCTETDQDDSIYFAVKPFAYVIGGTSYFKGSHKRHNAKYINEIAEKAQTIIEQFKDTFSLKFIQSIKNTKSNFIIEKDFDKIKFSETEFTFNNRNDKRKIEYLATSDIKKYLGYTLGVNKNVKDFRVVKFNKKWKL